MAGVTNSKGRRRETSIFVGNGNEVAFLSRRLMRMTPFRIRDIGREWREGHSRRCSSGRVKSDDACIGTRPMREAGRWQARSGATKEIQPRVAALCR